MPKYQNYPVDIYKNLKEMFNASAEKFGDKTLFMENCLLYTSDAADEL